MKTHKITIKNFQSLRECTIDTLDEHLNFFVGPNGSGKTSVFRALRILKESFEAAGTGTSKALDHLYSVQANPQQIDISVEVSWNTDREKKAICAFLYASLTTTRPLDEAIKRIPHLSTYQITPEKYELFTCWLREQCAPERLQFLFVGELHLTYREDNSTRLSYKFICKGEPVTILMAAYPPQDGTFWKGLVPVSPTPWKSGTDILLEYLFSARDALENDDTKALVEKGDNTEARAEKYFAYRLEEKPTQLDMAEFLFSLAEKHGYVEIGTVNASQMYLPEYILLKELSGVNFSQTNHDRLSCSQLFYFLLHNALVFTKSVFAPFEEPVPFDSKRVFSLNKTLNDENDIPYWLLGIKNGTIAEKERYQQIQNRFKMFTGEDGTFDITVKTHIQFSSNGVSSEVPMIDILVTDATKTISMASQGSGLWDALVLSVFLSDSKGQVILLDEPAAGLHPNMQRHLVEILHSVPGQVIVVTHSAHLLPTRADRLQHVYRFQKKANSDQTDGTQIFSGGSFLQVELQKIENKFASSINVASLLFANGVLLVEGATEIGAFSVWIPLTEKGKGQTLVDMNIVLHDSGGKSGFPFYLCLLKDFGIPYAVIGDGDSLRPCFIDKKGNEQKNKDFSSLWKILKEHCPEITVPQETDSFPAIKSEAARAGFYTYDGSNPIEFEDIPEVEIFLQGFAQPKKKADTIYEARLLAEGIPVVPSLAENVLNQAIARLRSLKI